MFMVDSSSRWKTLGQIKEAAGFLPQLVDDEAKFLAESVNKEFPDYRLFQKAAYIAHDPGSFHKLSNLQREEVAALQREDQMDFWHQPKPFINVVIFLCLSATVQGWAESTFIDANLSWASTDIPNLKPSKLDTLTFATANSIPSLAATLGAMHFVNSCMLVSKGKLVIMLSCFYLLCALGSVVPKDHKIVLWLKTLCGMVTGANAAITMLFAAEISSQHLR
ncbi:hypothetical protein H2198_002528 [Neophaeococcomyces mojaviensis]|uniref:Uncharacterized protein n=1 Tax=Neophaeococcomyces mojaviensis TaxID=3383035 RepID=A0ACC3ADR2_9EURO|nr:hypothetical protein H2198_002528 [Knufia sp. JES_112]